MGTRRQLAAVMFTDIVDFTSTMQTDEEKAMNLRNSHRKILDSYHLQYNGEVINYMGDGTVSIFNSSRDAVECAIKMQKAFRKNPKVPLRIGIHEGEILRLGDDIAGDAVNIASRIESIAVAGSILISAKVYDDLKNQNWIETVSIGFYEFKNVDKAKEVFAISNEGLMVPDPETITGKLKDIKSKTESEKTFSHLIKELWKRKVFLVLGLYLIALLIVLQIVKSIIHNYPISPYWYELILVFFLSFLPSIIIHTYHHNRIELFKLKIVEKISIPFNLILSFMLLIFMFYGKDLGATTQTFKIQDEFGNLIEKEIVKSEFTAKLKLFYFENKTGDSLLNWLEFGIPSLIRQDIAQDNYVLISLSRGSYSLGEMINIAKNEYWPYFATGEIQKKEGSYIIKTKLYSSEYGKFLQEREVKGESVFDICDSLSVSLKKDINVPKYYIQNSKDLPVKSIMTGNIKAFEAMIKAITSNTVQERLSGYVHADSLDPSFAMNNYIYASALFDNKFHNKEAVIAIKKAMKYRFNVSDLLKIKIETLNYKINKQNDKSIAYNELQVELNPEYANGYLELMTEYNINGYYEKALTALQKYYKIEVEDNWAILNQVWLLKILNRNQEALDLIISYIDNFPKDLKGIFWLGDIYLSLGDLKKAEEIFIKASLLEPDNSAIHTMLKHIKYLTENGRTDFGHPNQFIGKLRSGEYQFEEEIVVRNGRVFQQDYWWGLHQLYPINDSTLVYIGQSLKSQLQQALVYTFSKDNDGKYYKYNFHVENFKLNSEVMYSVNQEIRNAENLLIENQDKAALESYEIALKNNPGHHFLKEFINHLKFKKTNAYKLLYAELNGFSLNYNNQRITCEDGQLFFWQIGNGLKFKMLPISSEEFIIQEKWLAKIKLIKDDGKITGFELSFSE